MMNEREYIAAIETALIDVCKKMDCESMFPDLMTVVKKRYSTRKLVDKLDIGMKPVDSSNIDSMGYNVEHSVLKVRFVNGGQYAYLDVPDNILTEATKADSIGKYFNANVRNKFECVKIN